MQDEEILWTANPISAARPWRRFLKGGAGLAGVGVLPLAPIISDGLSGLLTGAAVTVIVCAAWIRLLVRDLRSLTSIRVLYGDIPQLWMTTNGGRTLSLAAVDVSSVEVVYRPFTADPDGTMILELRFRDRRVGRVARWDGGSLAKARQAVQTWERVCPAATVTMRVRERHGGGEGLLV